MTTTPFAFNNGFMNSAWFSVCPLESLYTGKHILSQNTQYSNSIPLSSFPRMPFLLPSTLQALWLALYRVSSFVSVPTRCTSILIRFHTIT
jgi:hypothetical protein